MDLGLNSGERPPLSVSLSGHRGAGGRYNIKTREFIFCARRVVDTLRKYEKIIPFSIYIYSGPPYLLLSVRGQSARKSLKLNHARTARDPRARRPPVTCQAAQLRTGAYERHLRRQLQDGKCSLCFLTTLHTRSPAAAAGSAPHMSGVDQVGVDSASSKATRPASPMWLLQMCSSLSTGAPVALSDAASATAPCHAKEQRESSVLYTPLPRSGGAGGSGGGVTPRGDTSRLHEACSESAPSLQA